jgi:hypothetical protein
MQGAACHAESQVHRRTRTFGEPAHFERLIFGHEKLFIECIAKLNSEAENL